MGVSVASLASEQHRAVRHGVGLLDRSERGKLALTGPEARELLNGQISNEVLSLTPGQGCYAALLTPKGKMLGDLRVLAAAAPFEELCLDTERTALQDLFDVLRRGAIGYDAQLHKRTLERGLLSLVGPHARRAAGLTAEDPPGAEEHANAVARIAGIEVLLVTTDLGLDLLCDAARTDELRRALETQGAIGVDEAVVEVLRVERGRPRYGIDLDSATIPQEAGLNDRAVSFTKGCYVGQETVARLHYRGRPNRHLLGLRLTGPAAPGDPLRLGERELGRLGSVARSPQLGWIALALVRREGQAGDRVSVGAGEVSAELVELPFDEEHVA
ncbi:MAG TPA: glycine cleavage T C-terminal barrel domain-containing protein [Solirubrobacteraceae bacterium]|jgi:folate-binding protein YgfZ|nr:glycine cleavage T C-terminal barrel domain-containing protein [Solirubrobacteraceae bacterium]